MPIPEAILNQMKCCFLKDDHIAIEPILASCGGNICKKCVIDSKEETIKCFGCNESHKKGDLLKAPINKLAESMVHSFLNDLFEYMELTLEKFSVSVKGILVKN